MSEWQPSAVWEKPAIPAIRRHCRAMILPGQGVEPDHNHSLGGGLDVADSVSLQSGCYLLPATFTSLRKRGRTPEVSDAVAENHLDFDFARSTFLGLPRAVVRFAAVNQAIAAGK